MNKSIFGVRRNESICAACYGILNEIYEAAWNNYRLSWVPSAFLMSDLVYSSLYVESINTTVDVLVEWLLLEFLVRERMDLIIIWIIHLVWWKSRPTHHTRHHRHFSASSFQLIFIHAMRDRKCDARRSKLKRPRTAKVQLIFRTRLRENEEKEKFMNVENDWNFKRCLFDGSCDVTNFYFSFKLFSLKRAINRQILITWQSSRSWC